jgi:glycosyltransferase involved in cell wall biosynthesis
VPNAVHPSFFEVCRHPDKTPRILCVANIGMRKNQIGLIHSLEFLAKATPLKLVFAGGASDADPYFHKFKDMVRNREWCEYRGPLDRAALQSEMALASVGVLPSFEDNCPMVILEAAAGGIPFAASRVGGVPDLIEDNITGLLFDPSSQDEIRIAITRMLQDKHLAQSVAATALTACRHRFSPEAVALEHLKIYNAVLNESVHMKSVSTH